MSVAQLGTGTWAAPAGADLTGKLFYLAALDSNGAIVVAGDDGVCIGVIIEEATSGNPASVQLDGVGKVILGASLDPGVRVEASSTGTAEAYTTGPSAGTLLKGGQSGEIVPIKLAAA